jgi:hypothetical protein
MSENVVGKVDVGFYAKEKPGMGQALKGQMVLTDRRFIYIRYLGGKYLTAKTHDYSDNIDEGLKNEGSFAVPLNMITEAKADRVCGEHRTLDYATRRRKAKKSARSLSFHP